ncbi:MAG: nucleoside deaminase [Halomonas sp.]|uniref:nucleoside deaminase n=1 Tax=Halomonas sp. TaxID=1486246 RepID=UPI003F8FB120
MIRSDEEVFLQRSLALAEEALAAGDEPFGSVLVSADGKILFEDRNRIAGGDATRHPEFEIARWAAQNLTPEQRASSVVYTSGEHCAMCSAAHGWVGLGRIVYASSSAQLTEWLTAMNVELPKVAALPIQQVVPGLEVDGPIPGFDERVHALHRRRHGMSD